MTSWLKKYFIPHEGNDHKPHILRWASIRIAIVVLVAIEGLFLLQVAFVSNSSNYLADVVASVLISNTNQNRVADSLQPLTVNPLLQEAAQLKADDMVANNYFAHVSPSGLTPWYWMQKVGYSYSYAGENLAVDFVDSNDVVNAWMNSPEHRANILDGNFTDIGIGIAQGQYEGRPATFVVQMFGAPAETAATAVVAAAPTAPAAKSQSAATAVTVGGVAASQVLGVSATSASTKIELPQPGPVDKAVTSPSMTADWVLAAMALLFVVALGLKVFINLEIQHPSLIVNGVIVILIVDSLLLLNRYIALAQLKIA